MEAAGGILERERDAVHERVAIDARALRLFLWKLHNAVSSSISRQEEWYQRRGSVLYTNRFWPSLESELSRAKALRSATVPRTRLEVCGRALSLAPSLPLSLGGGSLGRARPRGSRDDAGRGSERQSERGTWHRRRSSVHHLAVVHSES